MVTDSRLPHRHVEIGSDEDGEETTDVIAVSERVVVRQKADTRDRLTLIALLGDHGQRAIAVSGVSAVIGRGQAADIRLDDSGLSRSHVRLYCMEGNWFAEDLGSRNGTFVDGVRISSPHHLTDGARLQVGRSNVFRIALHDEAEQEATRRMAESAVTDPLTKTFNRRYLDERLGGELAYALRHKTSLSVLLLDIDHFKSVNDTFGHLAGDAVLRILGGTLRKVVRAEDVVARYGGEEFAVVARGTDSTNALILAERVRRLCERVSLPWEGETIRFTVSIGISCCRESRPFASVSELLSAADSALYRAKREGRNRCVVDRDESGTST